MLGFGPDVFSWIYSTDIVDSEEGTSWEIVEGTKVEHGICGLQRRRNADEDHIIDDIRPGFYRLFGELEIEGEVRLFISRRILEVPGDPFGGQWADEKETAIKASTWGELKEKFTDPK